MCMPGTDELKMIRLATVLALIVLVLFVSGCLLYPNRLYNLDGSVGVIDHGKLFDTLAFPFREIYFFGDFGCHQQTARSFIINGSQMPLCIRETSLIIGVAVGGILLQFIHSMSVRKLLTIALILTPLTFIEIAIKAVFNNLFLCSLTSILSGCGATIILFCIFQAEFHYLDSKRSGQV